MRVCACVGDPISGNWRFGDDFSGFRVESPGNGGVWSVMCVRTFRNSQIVVCACSSRFVRVFIC